MNVQWMHMNLMPAWFEFKSVLSRQAVVIFSEYFVDADKRLVGIGDNCGRQKNQSEKYENL